MTSVDIREESPDGLASYFRMPTAFEVREQLDLSGMAVGWQGRSVHRLPVASPYQKDYDTIPGNHPDGWVQRFERTDWAILVARAGSELVGGAVIALDNPDVRLIDGVRSHAVLWDIRVIPSRRGQGIGAALFARAEAWGRMLGRTRLQVETQDINVEACLFYARRGCTLDHIRRDAYPGFPGEVQLIWGKSLIAPATTSLTSMESTT